MGKANGVREVGYFDCVGGGQIVVVGNYAYIGHVDKTTGTTIADVSDPKRLRSGREVPTVFRASARKVHVAIDLMRSLREHPPSDHSLGWRCSALPFVRAIQAFGFCSYSLAFPPPSEGRLQMADPVRLRHDQYWKPLIAHFARLHDLVAE